MITQLTHCMLTFVIIPSVLFFYLHLTNTNSKQNKTERERESKSYQCKNKNTNFRINSRIYIYSEDLIQNYQTRKTTGFWIM